MTGNNYGEKVTSAEEEKDYGDGRGRAVQCKRSTDWRRRQQNKSTGDRNAQLSSGPEAAVGVHVAGMRICPALIFRPGTVCSWTACLRNEKESQTYRHKNVADARTHTRTGTRTLVSDCGNTQRKVFKGSGQVRSWNGTRDDKKGAIILTVGWQRDEDMQTYRKMREEVSHKYATCVFLVLLSWWGHSLTNTKAQLLKDQHLVLDKKLEAAGS